MPDSAVRDLLERGRITDCEALYSGSNRVFLLTLVKERRTIRAVYKPCAGERPLWDFTDGTLYQREYAAYLVSQALGWFIVPPTVIRDGPHGVGSVQWFIENSNTDYGTLGENHSFEIKRIAVFDCLINNADRKGGHLLKGQDGHIWAIDNALSFNIVPKLRTIIWDFAGQSIPAEFVADLKAFRREMAANGSLKQALCGLLEPHEIQALEIRLNGIIDHPFFPYPTSHRSMPWPPF